MIYLVGYHWPQWIVVPGFGGYIDATELRDFMHIWWEEALIRNIVHTPDNYDNLDLMFMVIVFYGTVPLHPYLL